MANANTNSELKFLLKHSSIYGIGTMLSRLVSFLMLPLYTRVLTPADYGTLELIDVSISMISLVLAMGAAQAMSRFYYVSDIPAERNTVVSTTLILVAVSAGIGLSIISYFADNLSQLIFDTTRNGELIAVALGSLGAGLLIDVAQIYFRVKQRSVMYIAVSLINLTGNVTLNIVFLVVLDYGVIGILYSSLITKICIAVPLISYLIYLVGIRFSRQIARDLMHYAIPLIPSQLANAVVNQSDRFMINYFVSLEAAGIYGMAQKIGSAVHMLTTAPFIQTFLPRRFEIAEQPHARDVFRDAFYFHMLGLLIIWLLACLMSDTIMYVMTTPKYYVAADFLPLIAAGLICLGMKYHFEFGILYSKRTIYFSYIYIAASILHISLNFLLIPTLSVWGALIASVVAYAFNALMLRHISRRFYRVDYGASALLPFSIGAAALIGAKESLPAMNAWLALLLNSLVFVAFLALSYKLKWIDERAVAAAKGAMAKFGLRKRAI